MNIRIIFVSFISATLICFRFVVKQNGLIRIENMLMVNEKIIDATKFNKTYYSISIAGQIHDDLTYCRIFLK